MDDKTHTFTSPSIFGLLESHGQSAGAIYGYDAQPLTKCHVHRHRRRRRQPTSAVQPTSSRRRGRVPCPPSRSWSRAGPRPATASTPNYDVALGEQLIHDVYQAVRGGPGWPQTLLVITYDEHGGCYDHVPPPSGATPPDSNAGEFGFDFTRFGVRVPAVLVSPLIAPGTVFRAPAGSAPLDHTSILKTVAAALGAARADRPGRRGARAWRRADPEPRRAPMTRSPQ